MSVRAAYIHVPFCARRCGYCNFTVVTGRDDLIEAYLQAVARELSWLGCPHEVDTLFFGGGTPTHLPPDQLRRLLRLARDWFPLADEYEATVEANPSDVTAARLAVLVECGINRVSLGVQSFHDAKLAVLERDHRRSDVERALSSCRDRFSSVAIDLIFGTPGESLAMWQADLQHALDAGVDHISAYGLTYEKGAAFWSRRARGQLVPVSEEAELAMYETAISTLRQAGFEHYEVSNFARPGHRSRHNQTYWRGGGYYAAGPGAARYVDGWRETNHRSTTAYLRRVLAGRSPVAEREKLDAAASARERLVFGLRMLEGVAYDEFSRHTGFAIRDLVGEQLCPLLEAGLLDDSGSHLRLTHRGLVISDSIWPRFLEQA